MKNKGKTHRVMFRRKREGRTNYKKRLSILKSNKLRLVVRRSLKNIQANIIDYGPKGDKVILSANSKELEKLGWKFNTGNVPAAYLTGLLLGNKAKKNGVEGLVLDIGLHKSTGGSRIYAVLAGVLDAGLKIAHNPKVLPSKERLAGKHVSDFASKIEDKKEDFERQFSNYVKNKVNPADITKYFEKVKAKIIGGNDEKEN
ncbi:50S ribosomal protein L18 [Candidatus Woesearchaeota archaeon]|nr:50S ribosomal protein L18 [Candidatus Woesearchaeota archaeon]